MCECMDAQEGELQISCKFQWKNTTKNMEKKN